MRTFKLILIVFAFIAIALSCEKKTSETPPELPPMESMSIDFSKFGTNEKSAGQLSNTKSTAENTSVNYVYAAGNVVFWSVFSAVTLAVPAATFQRAFSETPVFLGEATWQWSYSVNVTGANYLVRLTGKVRSDDVKWEMNIAREGIGAYPEFLWYEGTSLLNGEGGQWVLNYSNTFQEPVLQIDWHRENNVVGEISYTNIRDLNDDRSPNLFKGSFIEAGYQNNELDAYYSIHVYEQFISKTFIDINMEWSTSTYNGRVKSENKFGDSEWHCWDPTGYDTVCE